MPGVNIDRSANQCKTNRFLKILRKAFDGCVIGIEDVGIPDFDTFLEKLPVLNLSNCSLNDVRSIRLCQSLQRLDLSQNNIDFIECLANCHKLWEINLAYNKIKLLTGLHSFIALGFLNLSYNDIGWQQLAVLQQVHILHLHLFGNKQLVSTPYYRYHVIDSLPLLWCLDGLFITSAEKLQVKYFFEQSAFSRHPQRHKLKPARSFTPSALYHNEACGVYGPQAVYLLRQFPRDGLPNNIDMDERKLIHLIHDLRLKLFDDLSGESDFRRSHVVENLFTSQIALIMQLLVGARRHGGGGKEERRAHYNLLVLLLFASLRLPVSVELVKTILVKHGVAAGDEDTAAEDEADINNNLEETSPVKQQQPPPPETAQAAKEESSRDAPNASPSSPRRKYPSVDEQIWKVDVLMDRLFALSKQERCHVTGILFAALKVDSDYAPPEEALTGGAPWPNTADYRLSGPLFAALCRLLPALTRRAVASPKPPPSSAHSDASSSSSKTSFTNASSSAASSAKLGAERKEDHQNHQPGTGGRASPLVIGSRFSALTGRLCGGGGGGGPFGAATASERADWRLVACELVRLFVLAAPERCVRALVGAGDGGRVGHGGGDHNDAANRPDAVAASPEGAVGPSPGLAALLYTALADRPRTVERLMTQAAAMLSDKNGKPATAPAQSAITASTAADTASQPGQKQSATRSSTNHHQEESLAPTDAGDAAMLGDIDGGSSSAPPGAAAALIRLVTELLQQVGAATRQAVEEAEHYNNRLASARGLSVQQPSTAGVATAAALPMRPLSAVLAGAAHLSAGEPIPTPPYGKPGGLPVVGSGRVGACLVDHVTRHHPHQAGLPRSMGRSQPQSPIPKLGHRVLVGPQNVGRIVALPEPGLALLQLSLVPAFTGAMVVLDPDQHLVFFDLTAAVWQPAVGLWQRADTISSSGSDSGGGGSTRSTRTHWITTMRPRDCRLLADYPVYGVTDQLDLPATEEAWRSLLSKQQDHGPAPAPLSASAAAGQNNKNNSNNKNNISINSSGQAAAAAVVGITDTTTSGPTCKLPADSRPPRESGVSLLVSPRRHQLVIEGDALRPATAPPRRLGENVTCKSSQEGKKRHLGDKNSISVPSTGRWLAGGRSPHLAWLRTRPHTHR